MSIEKKSLISVRSASKKALVVKTKPEVTAVAPARLAKPVRLVKPKIGNIPMPRLHK